MKRVGVAVFGVLFLILALIGCQGSEQLAVTAPTEPCTFPLPLASQVGKTVFEAALFAFLDNKCYQTLDWQHDKDAMRWTIHGMIRIYYSPQVYAWMQGGREGDLPDNSLIVKEQFAGSGSDYSLSWWTIMAMDRSESADGWFWSYHPVPKSELASINLENAETAYPESMFGKTDCLNCHASAISESTFVELKNIEESQPLFAEVLDDPAHDSPDESPHGRSVRALLRARKLLKTQTNQPDPAFLKVYGIDTAPQLSQIKALPGEGLDHVVSGPEGPEEFITSDQCIGCHDATYNTYNLRKGPSDPPDVPPNMLHPQQLNQPSDNLSPYAEAHSSVMGLSGRDPVFFAQLESEGVIHASDKANIQNTCLSCHGVMGQRQLFIDKQEFMSLDMIYAIDGEYAKYGALARDGVSCTVCHHIVIDESKPFDQTFTGKFDVGPAGEVYGPYKDDVKTLPMDNALKLKPVVSPALKNGHLMLQSAKLCGSCHTVYVDVLNDQGKAIGKTYEQATYLEWLNSTFQNETAPVSAEAQTCQDCHMKSTIHDKGGKLADLAYKIANIEDNTYTPIFPLATQLPNADLDLPVRSPFSRHSFLGINLFTMEMYRQFVNSEGNNEILGIRTVDPMTVSTAAKPLDSALETSLDQAENESATISVLSASSSGGNLTAEVQVVNLTGHHFPSGVGFRRAFIEFQVTDASGTPIWTSGGTDAFGEILGPDGKVLPTEFFEEIDGVQVYQPAYQTISKQNQVQIYEELTKAPDGKFTTSFLSLYQHVKDNRLQPKGWRADGPYADVTKPDGSATKDCAYRVNPACPGYGTPSTGSDTLTYQIPLSDISGTPAGVKATLYYQSIPPYYLADRFKLLKECQKRNPSDPWTDCFPETLRLLYMTSGLNTNASVSGQQPIQNWKIAVGSATRLLP